MAIEVSRLKDLLSQEDYTRGEKLLLCLAADPVGPKSVSEIKALALEAGLRAVTKWNISALLTAARPLVVRAPAGWELTMAGNAKVASLAGPIAATPAVAIAAGLRHLSAKLANKDVRAFVEEAVSCFEWRQYRAAIVLAWVGAMAVLYDHVVQHELTSFNREALARDASWRAAKTADDLARLKEVEFLLILDRCSIIGKSVRQELEGALRLRNGCGHPNSLKVGEAKAAAHLETLIQNVFARFAT
jgi:hypothetical protein